MAKTTKPLRTLKTTKGFKMKIPNKKPSKKTTPPATAYNDQTTPPPADALENMLLEMAGAIWETWRTSEIAKKEFADLGWDELCDLAKKNPGTAPAKFVTVAIAEAAAALRVMKKHPFAAAVSGAKIYLVSEISINYDVETVGAFSSREKALDALNAVPNARQVNMTLGTVELDGPLSA